MKKSKRSTAEQRKNMRADEEQRERIIKVKTILQGTNLVEKNNLGFQLYHQGTKQYSKKIKIYKARESKHSRTHFVCQK